MMVHCTKAVQFRLMMSEIHTTYRRSFYDVGP